MFSAREHVDVRTGMCVYVSVCVSNPRLPLESPIHPSPVCEIWRRVLLPKWKTWSRLGAVLFFSLSLSPFFFPCGWLFFYIYLPSRRPVLSPITHPPFYTLVWPFLQLPLPHSGADVNSVALSRLPTAPYNAHLYFTLREQFSCLFLDECCKMFCRGRIVWLS